LIFNNSGLLIDYGNGIKLRRDRD